MQHKKIVFGLLTVLLVTVLVITVTLLLKTQGPNVHQEALTSNNCLIDTLYPDQTDCSKFYSCTPYGFQIFNCPLGLHFNPTAKYCDWPVNAGCTALTLTTEGDLKVSTERDLSINNVGFGNGNVATTLSSDSREQIIINSDFAQLTSDKDTEYVHNIKGKKNFTNAVTENEVQPTVIDEYSINRENFKVVTEPTPKTEEQHNKNKKFTSIEESFESIRTSTIYQNDALSAPVNPTENSAHNSSNEILEYEFSVTSEKPVEVLETNSEVDGSLAISKNYSESLNIVETTENPLLSQISHMKNTVQNMPTSIDVVPSSNTIGEQSRNLTHEITQSPKENISSFVHSSSSNYDVSKEQTDQRENMLFYEMNCTASTSQVSTVLDNKSTIPLRSTTPVQQNDVTGNGSSISHNSSVSYQNRFSDPDISGTATTEKNLKSDTISQENNNTKGTETFTNEVDYGISDIISLISQISTTEINFNAATELTKEERSTTTVDESTSFLKNLVTKQEASINTPSYREDRLNQLTENATSYTSSDISTSANFEVLLFNSTEDSTVNGTSDVTLTFQIYTLVNETANSFKSETYSTTIVNQTTQFPDSLFSEEEMVPQILLTNISNEPTVEAIEVASVKSVSYTKEPLSLLNKDATSYTRPEISTSANFEVSKFHKTENANFNGISAMASTTSQMSTLGVDANETVNFPEEESNSSKMDDQTTQFPDTIFSKKEVVPQIVVTNMSNETIKDVTANTILYMEEKLNKLTENATPYTSSDIPSDANFEISLLDEMENSTVNAVSGLAPASQMSTTEVDINDSANVSRLDSTFTAVDNLTIEFPETLFSKEEVEPQVVVTDKSKEITDETIKDVTAKTISYMEEKLNKLTVNATSYTSSDVPTSTNFEISLSDETENSTVNATSSVAPTFQISTTEVYINESANSFKIETNFTAMDNQTIQFPETLISKEEVEPQVSNISNETTHKTTEEVTTPSNALSYVEEQLNMLTENVTSYTRSDISTSANFEISLLDETVNSTVNATSSVAPTFPIFTTEVHINESAHSSKIETNFTAMDNQTTQFPEIVFSKEKVEPQVLVTNISNEIIDETMKDIPAYTVSYTEDQLNMLTENVTPYTHSDISTRAFEISLLDETENSAANATSSVASTFQMSTTEAHINEYANFSKIESNFTAVDNQTTQFPKYIFSKEDVELQVTNISDDTTRETTEEVTTGINALPYVEEQLNMLTENVTPYTRSDISTSANFEISLLDETDNSTVNATSSVAPAFQMSTTEVHIIESDNFSKIESNFTAMDNQTTQFPETLFSKEEVEPQVTNISNETPRETTEEVTTRINALSYVEEQLSILTENVTPYTRSDISTSANFEISLLDETENSTVNATSIVAPTFQISTTEVHINESANSSKIESNFTTVDNQTTLFPEILFSKEEVEPQVVVTNISNEIIDETVKYITAYTVSYMADELNMLTENVTPYTHSDISTSANFEISLLAETENSAANATSSVAPTFQMSTTKVHINESANFSKIESNFTAVDNQTTQFPKNLFSKEEVEPQVTNISDDTTRETTEEVTTRINALSYVEEQLNILTENVTPYTRSDISTSANYEISLLDETENSTVNATSSVAPTFQISTTEVHINESANSSKIVSNFTAMDNQTTQFPETLFSKEDVEPQVTNISNETTRETTEEVTTRNTFSYVEEQLNVLTENASAYTSSDISTSGNFEISLLDETENSAANATSSVDPTFQMSTTEFHINEYANFSKIESNFTAVDNQTTQFPETLFSKEEVEPQVTNISNEIITRETTEEVSTRINTFSYVEEQLNILTENATPYTRSDISTSSNFEISLLDETENPPVNTLSGVSSTTFDISNIEINNNEAVNFSTSESNSTAMANPTTKSPDNLFSEKEIIPLIVVTNIGNETTLETVEEATVKTVSYTKEQLNLLNENATSNTTSNNSISASFVILIFNENKNSTVNGMFDTAPISQISATEFSVNEATNYSEGKTDYAAIVNPTTQFPEKLISKEAILHQIGGTYISDEITREALEGVTTLFNEPKDVNGIFDVASTKSQISTIETNAIEPTNFSYMEEQINLIVTETLEIKHNSIKTDFTTTTIPVTKTMSGINSDRSQPSTVEVNKDPINSGEKATETMTVHESNQFLDNSFFQSESVSEAGVPNFSDQTYRNNFVSEPTIANIDYTTEEIEQITTVSNVENQNSQTNDILQAVTVNEEYPNVNAALIEIDGQLEDIIPPAESLKTIRSTTPMVSDADTITEFNLDKNFVTEIISTSDSILELNVHKGTPYTHSTNPFNIHPQKSTTEAHPNFREQESSLPDLSSETNEPNILTSNIMNIILNINTATVDTYNTESSFIEDMDKEDNILSTVKPNGQLTLDEIVKVNEQMETSTVKYEDYNDLNSLGNTQIMTTLDNYINKETMNNNQIHFPTKSSLQAIKDIVAKDESVSSINNEIVDNITKSNEMKFNKDAVTSTPSDGKTLEKIPLLTTNEPASSGFTSSKLEEASNLQAISNSVTLTTENTYSGNVLDITSYYKYPTTKTDAETNFEALDEIEISSNTTGIVDLKNNLLKEPNNNTTTDTTILDILTKNGSSTEKSTNLIYSTRGKNYELNTFFSYLPKTTESNTINEALILPHPNFTDVENKKFTLHNLTLMTTQFFNGKDEVKVNDTYHTFSTFEQVKEFKKNKHSEDDDNGSDDADDDDDNGDDDNDSYDDSDDDSDDDDDHEDNNSDDNSDDDDNDEETNENRRNKSDHNHVKKSKDNCRDHNDNRRKKNRHNRHDNKNYKSDHHKNRECNNESRKKSSERNDTKGKNKEIKSNKRGKNKIKSKGNWKG